MIEYLFDAVRVEAGETFTIAAAITDENGETVSSPCRIVIYDTEGKEIEAINGTLENDLWNFTVSGSLTKNYIGRYFYCIKCGSESLSFKTALYFRGV